MKFYNRINEIKSLKNDIKISKNSFIFKVFSWIRRIGKTSLITKAVVDSKEKYLYLYITHSKHVNILIQEIKDLTKSSLWVDLKGKSTLREIFEELFIYWTKNYYILVIDEFQNFEYIDKSFFWDFQYLIDTYWTWVTRSSKHWLSKMLLICTGSYVSLINKIFAFPTAPLFRRSDANIKIKELAFKYILEICNDHWLDFNDTLRMYTLFWWIPYYYEKIIKNNLHTKSISEIFKSMFLILEREKVKLILETELKSNQLSFAILEGVSLGNNTKKDLMLYLYWRWLKPLDYKSKYRNLELTINNLIELEILINKQKVPNTRIRQATSRYFIINRFFKIYFKYVYKNSSLIEEGSYNFVIDTFKRDFEKDLWIVYEDIVKEFLLSWNYWLKFSEIWKWWKWSKEEIDILWVNDLDNFMLWVECKYSVKKKWVDVIEKLIKRMKLINWDKKNSKTSFLFLIVSHCWFTREAIEYAKMNKIDLLNTTELKF